MLINPRDGVRPGEVVGEKYVVERVIGSGGMGTVVSANDTLLNRRVAIKFLLPEVSERPAAMGRFLREARATAGLQSEHVVRVIDAGTRASGTPYIVMEYLDGRDLGEYLRAQYRGTNGMPVSEAIDLVLQAGEAIAEAHSIGIVHRDLKPSNLFVTEDLDGRRKVKVLDFGISMFVDQSAMSDGRALTGTGDLIGSPLYMSPEQLRDAHRVTAQTDIWALGVILYELLAGVSPFQSETMTAICARIVSEAPPPLREKRSDVPKKLEQVILACLEKKESRRIQSVAELARRLAPFASDERAARRIAAMASRERRVAVSPSGRPLVDSVDTSGPTVADLGSGWSVRRRRHSRMRLAAIGALVVVAGTVWVLRSRFFVRSGADVIVVATFDSSGLPAHDERDENGADASASVVITSATASASPSASGSPAIVVAAPEVQPRPIAMPRPRPVPSHMPAPFVPSIPSSQPSSALSSPSAPSANSQDAGTYHPTVEQALDSRK